MERNGISSAFKCLDIPDFQNIEDSPNVDVKEVHRSALSGCTLCGVIWAAVNKQIDKETSGFSVTLWRSPSGLHVDLLFGGEKEARFSTLLYGTKDYEYGLIPLAGSVSGNTGSDQAFRQAAEWFLNCLNNHHLLCRTMPTDAEFLPHRLLDIGEGAGDKVLLRDTKGLEKVRYACLSHSWGGYQPLKTTTETLKDHLKDIPWPTIPKTFQDAITFARRFTLRYIWIDSLCIIQDSEEDWQQESALMANIYRNGIITLSAAASSGPYDGLFVSGDAKDTTESGSTSKGNSTRIENGSLPEKIPHRRADHPLLYRGWVFQERLLSPRVLHFGKHELIWECMQSYGCECSKGPFLAMDWFSEKSYFHPSILSTLPILHTANTWRELVQDFFHGMLSHEEDVFPAISGAAKVIIQSLEARDIRPKYIAGLWDCWFLEDLLWSISIYPEPKLTCRPKKWRAPTFSWASIVFKGGGRLNYLHFRLFDKEVRSGDERPHRMALTCIATLKEYECKHVGVDQTGQIYAAHITLVGPLMQARISKYGELVVSGQIRPIMEPRFHPDYDLSSPGKWHVAADESLWCLQIASQLEPHGGKPMYYLWCLILRRVDMQDEPIYERIGLAYWREDAAIPDDKWFDPECIQQGAVVKIV